MFEQKKIILTEQNIHAVSNNNLLLNIIIIIYDDLLWHMMHDEIHLVTKYKRRNNIKGINKTGTTEREHDGAEIRNVLEQL